MWNIRQWIFLVGLALTNSAFAATQEAPNTQVPKSDSVSPETNARSTAEKVTANTVRATPAGATFTVPAGWSIVTGPSLVVLEPPEPDLHFAIVDVTATNGVEAAKAAWALYRPDAKLAFRLATSIPPRNGWEDGQVIEYETSPNEHLRILAVARRSGAMWTVRITDGSQATAEKRAAPISLIAQSLRPKGYQRETFAGRKARALDAGRIAQLKEFVADAMKQLDIPGVGLALVDGNKVVYEGGLGVRKLGDPKPVDANTLFMIASNTKGMTTLLLAELVDEKKLRWDQTVTEVYPTFKLGNADTTSQVRVKHLICACTGLPRQDFEWMFDAGNMTPASSLGLLGTMQPTSGFGEVFQYSNVMAAAAGYIAGHIVYPKEELGAAYDRAMKEKVFDPLGMKSTTFDMQRAQRGNHASPHGDDIDGKPAVANMAFNYTVGPHRPAGGAWSSAHDMTHYVQLELAQGKLPNGKQFVSAENLLARRKEQVIVGEDMIYGMGLMAETKFGVPVVHHGGSMAGYKSNIYMLPESGIGAVLLTNSDTGQMLLRPFMRRLLEVVFDGKPEAVDDIASAAKRFRAALAKDRERLEAPAEKSQVAKLAQNYKSRELGRLVVEQRGGATVFDFGSWKSAVATKKNDDGTISFITIDPTNDGFEFVVTERSGKRGLVTRDGQHEYLYEEGS